MEICCDIVNQRFAWNFRGAGHVSVVLTQHNDQPLRLYLLQPSRHPSSSYPFTFDPSSGDPTVIAIISLRDVTGFPVTLASSQPLVVIPNGFEGILRTNTQEIVDYLAAYSERTAAFCIDLLDGLGNKTSPFRKDILLRSLDLGTTATATAPGFYYLPAITGLEGGTPTDLDAVPTVGRALNSLFRVVVLIGSTPVASEWKLIPGDAFTDLPAGIIRPRDYAGDTNPVNLVLVDGLAV